MTGKEYMHRISQMRRRIELLKEQIQRDTVMASGVGAIRYDKINVQTSPVADRMVDIVAKIIETTEKMEDEIHNLQIAQEECIGYLVQLREEHERALSYHYLDGMKWKHIAEKLGYDETYIYEMKDNALDELTQLLNKS